MGGVGDFLKQTSPMAGLITGEGTFGGLNKVAPIAMGIRAIQGKNVFGKKKKPAAAAASPPDTQPKMKCGGATKKMAKGGRIDGCATRGKTRCKTR